MIPILKYSRSKEMHYDISIFIPTWNNLPYLQLCLKSLQSNSTISIQPIVILNEGVDGSKTWILEAESIDFVYAEKNIGICYALNSARSLVKSNYILYANDDMYFLPGWDVALMAEINSIAHPYFMLSATMIEPINTGNPCVSVANYGLSLAQFDESRLLHEFHKYQKEDWSGSTWPPNIVHIDIWDLVGGLSIEFSPGMYSDPDFSKKLYTFGIRHFKGIGRSLVYHFGSQSTKKVRKNKGRIMFLMKWGMTSKSFSKHCLHLGQTWEEDLQLSHKFGFWEKTIVKLKQIKEILFA